ncbi:MAG: DUF3426 domain-containing protein [Steroidobacteraceae bacterium]
MTAADLRVGQGYVRCGRCSNVFNALLTLSEEPAVAAQNAPAAAPPMSSLHDAGAAEVESVHTGGTEVTEADTVGTGTFETIVLEGDAILQTEELVPQEEIDQELLLFKDAAAGADSDVFVNGELSREFGVPEPPAPRSSQPWLWAAGVLVLFALLAAQLINHWRNELATQPGWYGPMSQLYARLGIALNPAWDLTAYDLRQQGATGDGASGDIRVRVSLANRGKRAQPMPILRLTLLDRYGKRVAARDLQPGDYLNPTQLAMGFLRSDQRVDSEIAVKDPGPDAASFELDACLSGGSSTVRCANDKSTASP